MKSLRNYIQLLALTIALTACSSSSEWEDLPEPIAVFVSQYFPGDGVAHYGESEGVYHVELKGSAMLSFDTRYAWITVNGQGEILPQVFLFDQLPPALYEYIQEFDSLGAVYSVSRNTRTYEVTLTDSYLSYNIKSREITRQYPSND